jgi:transcriptional regulator with XRE-family HTH domain
MRETFGEYVKRLRTENNLTLTQLAAQLDMDSANLCKIENGRRDFDEKRLIKLAKFFNLNIDNVKTEFFSDLIAKKIYQSNYCHETLVLAEEKIKYLQQKQIKQGTLNL